MSRVQSQWEFSLAKTHFTLKAYSDSDWDGCPITRRSTEGFCTFLGKNLIYWSFKKQPTISKSSTEAEYRSLSEAASEITWISSVLRELGIPLLATPELYGGNLSFVYLTANPAFHKRTKHFETDYHYVRERVALGALVVTHVPWILQVADIFTKSLPVDSFCRLRTKLGVLAPSTPILRGDINATSSQPQNGCVLSTYSSNKRNMVQYEWESKINTEPKIKLQRSSLQMEKNKITVKA